MTDFVFDQLLLYFGGLVAFILLYFLFCFLFCFGLVLYDRSDESVFFSATLCKARRNTLDYDYYCCCCCLLGNLFVCVFCWFVHIFLYSFLLSLLLLFLFYVIIIILVDVVVVGV